MASITNDVTGRVTIEADTLQSLGREIADHGVRFPSRSYRIIVSSIDQTNPVIHRVSAYRYQAVLTPIY